MVSYVSQMGEHMFGHRLAMVACLSGFLIAQASTSSSAPNDATCAVAAKAAAAVMRSRQDGTSLADLLAAVETSPEEIRKLGRELVIGAFEIPRFSSEDAKERQVEEYRDKIHLICLKS